MKGRSVCSQELTTERQEGRRKRWGRRDAQSAAVYSPFSSLHGDAVAVKESLGSQPLGVSTTLPAGDYFSQHQPSPSFPKEHFCLTIQDVSSRKLDKDYHSGALFLFIIKPINRKIPNYKFPSGLSLLPQVPFPLSFLLVGAAESLQIMTDERGHLHV